MKKSIKKSIIALTLIFAMSVGMFASADTNASDLGSSWRIFTDQYNRGEQRTEADISDAVGTYKSWWYLYDGNNGNAQISYADIVDVGHRVAGPGVQFGIRSEYFWYTVSCDKNLSYTTSPIKLDTVKFGNLGLSGPTVKFYRYSNLIYQNATYCTVRQASKLAKSGETTSRNVKIFADGTKIDDRNHTFPNRSDDRTMVASDVYVTALSAPYYTWTSKVENGYYRIDLTSHYNVSATVSGSKGSASVATSPVDYGKNTTAAFTANAGYLIDYVTDNGTKSDITNAASYTYTVSDVKQTRSIVAYTVPINYTISYNLDGGSVSGNPTSYNIETATFTLKNPTKTGYTFAGWTGSNGSTAQTTVTIAKGSTGNKSYTAKWTPITYTVKYDGNGATSGSTASQTFAWGESKALNSNGFKKEFTVTYNANGGTASKTSETAASTFNGWEDRNDIIYNGVTYLWTTFDAPYYANRYTDLYNAFNYNKYSLIGHYVNNGMGENRDPKDPSGARSYYRADRLTVSNLTTVNNGTVTMYANWTPKNISLPTATRTGYTFNGWSGSDGKTYNANDIVTVTNNLTFTAKWTPINYTITYNLAGGSVSAANPTSYTVESNAITLNNPTKTGYTFAGWTGSNGATAQTSVTIAKGSTGDKTYTANWAVESYEITYDYNGGTDPGNPPSFTVESGEITLKNPTKEGYTFAGWTGANGSTPQTTVTISANSTGEKTYTANWTAETYTITYNLAGGSASGNPTSYTIESADISLNNPTREGYIFMGWTGSNGATAQTSVTIPTGSMGNKTYTATWLQAEYTITWKNEDGAVLKTEKVKYNETPTYSGETPTKASTAQYEYTFKGWSPDIAPATEDATYTAQYTENTRKYAITFKNEDGTVLETKPVEYGKTPTYTGATPTKAPTESEIFTFAGWSPALGSVTGEAEYTATYETSPRKYAIVWTNWDGSVLETDECEYGATPTYDGATPEKPKDNTNSYEFSSWEPAVVPVAGDATYKAVFTATELPPTADLIIETSGCKAEQSFVFTVKSNEDVTFKEIEVAIVGNGSATIKDIPTGAYTVTEENGWTWRYSDEYEKTVTVIAGEENKATFKNINEPTIKKWLSGLAALFK